MDFDKKQYIDFKVYSVTKIKKKYGFRVKLIYDDNSKNIIQKSGFKTQKEANNVRDITITELHNGTFVICDSINVKNFFTYWLEKVMREKITSDSYDAYKNVVYNHIIPSLGNIKMINLNRGHIQKFYNTKAKYSHSVVRLCKAVFNTALKYAKEKNVVSINVADGVNLPKCVKKKKYRTIEVDVKKTLTVDQVNLLIEKSKGTPIHLQVMFAVLMGLRKSEINGLKYSDIDFIHRTLRVQRQLGKRANTDNSELEIGEFTKQEIRVKTFSSNRELDIPDILFEAILEEKKKYERNKSRRINCKKTPFKDYGFICCSTLGNPRSKNFHFQHWKKLLKDTDLPNIRFHDLRTTYSTLLLKNNFNSKAVSKLMGHASEIITMDVYGDNEEIIADCVNEITDFIESVRPDKINFGDEFKDETDISIDDSIIQELVGNIKNTVST